MKSLKIILVLLIICAPLSSYAKMGAHPNCEDVEEIAEMHFQYPTNYKAIPDEFIFQMSDTSDCTMAHQLLYVGVGPTGSIFGSAHCADLGEKNWSCNKGNVDNANFDAFQGAYHYYDSPCIFGAAEHQTCEVRDIMLKYPEIIIGKITRESDDIVVNGNATKAASGWALSDIIISNMSCKIESSGVIKCGFPKTLVQNGKLQAKLVSDQSNKYYMTMDIDVPSSLLGDCSDGWSSAEQMCTEDVPVIPEVDCKKTPLADECDYDNDGIINKQDGCPKDPEVFHYGSRTPVDGKLDGCADALEKNSSAAAPIFSGPYLAGESKCSFVENSRFSFIGPIFVLFTLTIIGIGYSFATVTVKRSPRRKKVTKRIVDLNNL
ncbi:MAG: hypothetical protein HN337_02920 [Deltaproteobacteria bacterium]|jgi:hypothetical protein|nr:hypothetical protein [Deltaproteobacteria bacterium]